MRAEFLDILAGNVGRRVVWTADVDYWMSGERARGHGDPAWDSEEGYVRFVSSLGCMPYYWYGKFWVAQPEYQGVDVIVETDGSHTVTRWVEPAGELRAETLFLASSCSTATTRYPVQTEADLRLLLQILERRRLRPVGLNDYSERCVLWARYDGLPGVGLPRSPLPQFFHEWAGVQSGVYLLFDYPHLVQEVLMLLEQQEEPILEAVCKAGLPLVHFPDNLTSDHFAGLFERYMAGPYRRRLERLHAAGVRCAVHLDGTVGGLLRKLAQVGMDAVEALTPLPVGDMSLQGMRELVEDSRLVLWGGLPGAMFCRPFTWDDMRMHLSQLLEAWQGRPFVVGVADQVPANGDLDMCRRISDFITEGKLGKE